MKNQIKKYFGISLVLVMLLSSVVFANEADYGAEGTVDKETFTIEEMLVYAIEDEYLAKTEYEKIVEVYDIQRPFTNIIKSEQTHIDLLLPLFETYNVELPSSKVEEHVVLPASLEETFEIGVQAEINNIAMYEKFLSQELPEDIELVFERLKSASENHLKAFERGVERENGGFGQQNRQDNRSSNRNRVGNGLRRGK